MERAVLAQQNEAFHRHNVMVGENHFHCLACKHVVGRLVIYRHENVALRHEIIGVGGR